VVEGGHENTRSVTTLVGHSIDGTLEVLREFKEKEDPENKVQIITKEGFWKKTDELGRHRTEQSRAYAERATGDYLWQIDIDEFYRENDIKKIINLLIDRPNISQISFNQKSFWGGINYISDGFPLMKNHGGWHRIFKWNKSYKYTTHEPPTVIDENGIDLRNKQWLKGEELEKMGIYMYHYSLLFPQQVDQKVRLYNEEKPESCSGIVQWAENNYFKLSNPFRVHNLYKSPSWLDYFDGEHPVQIYNMMDDIRNNKINTKLRNNEDVERLLKTFSYKLLRPLYKIGGLISQYYFILNESAFKALRKIYRTFIPKKIN